MKKIVILSLLSFYAFLAQAQITNNFDSDWKFKLGDPQNANQLKYDDSSWRNLDLPHDWSIEGEYDEENAMADRGGYLPAGIGWYRKSIKVPQDWKGKHVEIVFDGVFMNSTVWLNGKKLGNRPYGWISFNYDISEEVNNSEKLVFAVRVDNSKQPSARWYTGSGIYAHTWINIKDPVHVVYDGIFVHTQNNNAIIETKVANTMDKPIKILMESIIINQDGKTVGIHRDLSSMKANSKESFNQKISVKSPKLWSPQNPYLYTLVTNIYSGNKKIDSTKIRFGFRRIEWKAVSGLWLNGKNIKLHGVANHQDAGAFGAAVPDKILRFRIQQLKDMGVNAIRTAHNPQTPIFYDICDELGILVMDEIFDGWHKKADEDYGARFFDEWWTQDITSWIKRDRNHPSIIIYSVGNETHGDVGKDLVALCHKLDSTRLVTSGHSSSQYMDVLGVNGHSEEKGFFDELKDNRPFVATENTHTWQVRGYYRTKTWYRDGYPNPKRKPYYIPDLTKKEVFTNDWIADSLRSNQKQVFNSSYDNATVRISSRQNIAQIRDIPFYSGSFRWTGYDYLGEAGYVHGGWPFRASMSGAIDLANFEKDLYYLYQSQWTSKPMIHILPHWTHPDVSKGIEIPVWVYSNCEEVELFQDGKSLGKIRPGKKWDKMQCEWLVPWRPGTLKAIGYKNGKIVAEEIVKTAKAPSELQLSIDGKALDPGKEDVVQVRATITDKNGEFYPYGENKIYFNIFGPGNLKALDNGSPVDDQRHYNTDNRKAFYGLAKAYVTSQEGESDIQLMGSAILGEKKQITSDTVSIVTDWINLRGKKENHNVEIYYTTDGSEPTQNSQRYNKPFEIKLETTVKALIIVDGKEVQKLSEKFGKDEGFVWKKL